MLRAEHFSLRYVRLHLHPRPSGLFLVHFWRMRSGQERARESFLRQQKWREGKGGTGEVHLSIVVLERLVLRERLNDHIHVLSSIILRRGNCHYPKKICEDHQDGTGTSRCRGCRLSSELKG